MPNKDLSQNELLSLYEGGAERLEALLAGLPENGLDEPLGPAEWTIRQILHHIVDTEEAFGLCLKIAIGSPGSNFNCGWYPGNDEWEAKMEYSNRDVEDTLALFKAYRYHISALLTHFQDRWDDKVTLSAFHGQQDQDLTVGAITGSLVGHLAEHMETIQRIREQKGF
jgi:uncharacterized damage-inducible protein DinB